MIFEVLFSGGTYERTIGFTKMPLRVCSLYSGSSGNSTLIAGDDAKILVDCGVSARAEELALFNVGVKPECIKGIFITHEHSDHIKGVGIMSRKYNIPVYANEKTWQAMEGKIGEIALSCQRIIKNGSEVYIDDLCVASFKTSHDAADSISYTVMKNNKKVSIVTDTGYISNGILDAVMGSQLMLLESNYDPKMLSECIYPSMLKQRIAGNKGHLSNDVCAETILKLIDSNIKYILLSHLSKESNTPEVAFHTVKSKLENNGVYIGNDVMVDMTYRDKSTHVYNLL